MYIIIDNDLEAGIRRETCQPAVADIVAWYFLSCLDMWDRRRNCMQSNPRVWDADEPLDLAIPNEFLGNLRGLPGGARRPPWSDRRDLYTDPVAEKYL